MNETPYIPCAIYTRKSNARGLEQEFNSLDAQREAAENYLASQRAQGYVALPDRYDDGGFTGGNVERPGLRRLMQDIESGRVKCVVVYKVDRLSRSLADFTRMMDDFNRHNVSFISVTQHFNTATSMGRLTLNILSSFAQFEREVGAERIRDKIAMQKAKGKHCGGIPPLGYDLVDHKYVINPAEAATVKTIFRRFAEGGSTTRLVRELAAEGIHTKSWTTVRGNHREGRPFDKGHLYRLLNNRLYLGVVPHNGQLHPGEHDAIITQALWDKVHSIFAQNGRLRANQERNATDNLLRGFLYCGHCGKAMVPSATTKNGRRYRYYLCGHAAKNGHRECELRIVPAHDLEDAVTRPLRRWLSSTALRSQVLRRTGREGVDATPQEIADAIAGLDATWEHLFPVEQARLIHLLVERIDVRANGMRLALRNTGLNTLIEEMGGQPFPDAGPEAWVMDDAGLAPLFDTPMRPTVGGQGFLPTEPFTPTGPTVYVPLRIGRRCGRKVIIVPETTAERETVASAPETTNPMIQALAKAHAWTTLIDDGTVKSYEDLARHLGLARPYIMRIMRLTLLAPDITEAILDGREPKGLSVSGLVASNFPLDWPEQRKALGFPAVAG